MTEHTFAGIAGVLHGLGYEPVPIPRGQKGPRIQGWQSIEITDDLVASWSEKYPDFNVGVRTRNTPALDIDVLDAEVAQLCENVAEELFGPMCVRVGQAPKRLLPFRADKPFRKMVLDLEDPFGQGFKIEVLGDGQQFVAYGIHPGTGKLYDWTSIADLGYTPRAELPELTPARVLEYFDAVAAALPSGWSVKGRPDQVTSAAGDDDALLSFQPKADKVSLESLRKALKFVDNAEDYDHWLKIGMALHHQFDGDADGLALWHEWSETAQNYDAAALDAKWESFHENPNYATPITARYILKHTTYREEAPVDARTSLRAEIEEALTGDRLLDHVLPLLVDAKLDATNQRALLLEFDARYKKLTGQKLGVRTLDKKVREIREAKSALFAAADENELTLEVDLARKVLSDLRDEGRHLKFFSKMWWSYRGGVWVRSEDTTIARRVMQSLLALSEAKDDRVGRLCARMTESRGDRLSALVATIVNIISMLVAEEGGDDPLNLSANTAPMVINCANVELWFTANGDMTVKQHDAKHLLTNQIGCEYDENATCPTWDAALSKVFSSCLDPDEVIRHFEEVFGYILQPTRHQATWVMMKGPGGNGKSFLLNIISTLLGEHAVVGASLNELANGVSAHFTDSLQGKLMLLDDDLKAGTLLPDDWMKKLSEAKLISANPKFGKAYNFTARCIPVILTNAWPNTVDLSDGLRRRAQVFESNHVLTEAEKDPTHARIIRENELPGVLNRLIAAYQRFLRRGERFDPPGECVAAKSNWFTSSNPTALFADVSFLRTGDQADFVKAQEVYDAYIRWMQHWEHNSRALGRNKFYEALNKLGFAVMRVHNLTVIRAVKFSPPEGASEFDE